MALTKENLINIYFVGATTLIAFIGGPLYIYFHGITAFDIWLMVFFIVATGLSVTVGYHRHFSHATFKTNNVMRFIMLFFGAASFEQSALAWSSQHRDHHRYVDTDNDPYSIKKGFYWAHMGWLFNGNYRFFYNNVDDLVKNKLIMNQARYYPAWCLLSGIAFPVLIGALFGHALAAFIFSVCFRIVFVHHSTWCINSVCHMFGKATYDTQATARDHWFVGFMTFGEGFHNYHHRFPNDFRNGVKWYHWDPSKWLIMLFEKIGLAWDLKRASEFRIRDARIKAEIRTAIEALERFTAHAEEHTLREQLHARYEQLIAKLAHWEQAFKGYQALIKERPQPQTRHLRQTFQANVERARASFLEMERQWRHFIEHQMPSMAVQA